MFCTCRCHFSQVTDRGIVPMGTYIIRIPSLSNQKENKKSYYVIFLPFTQILKQRGEKTPLPHSNLFKYITEFECSFFINCQFNLYDTLSDKSINYPFKMQIKILPIPFSMTNAPCL